MMSEPCNCDSKLRRIGLGEHMRCPVHGTPEIRDELERLRARVSRSSGVDAKAVREVAEELRECAFKEIRDAPAVTAIFCQKWADRLDSALAGGENDRSETGD